MYKRWYLRALQEQFDARLYPYGWDTPDFRPDARWLPAMPLPGKPSVPSIFAGGPEYVLVSEATIPHDAADFLPKTEQAGLRPRDIPMLREYLIESSALVEQGRLTWKRSPDDWFDMRIPGSFDIARADVATPDGDAIVLPAAASESEAFFLSFELPEHVVGWPRFVIDAPAGTIVELMPRESHVPHTGPEWFDTSFFTWSRFTCREGVNELECFDYDSFKWVQLHVRGHNRAVKISKVGCRRRIFPWPNEARLKTSDPELQKLFDAAVQTLHNSAQEHIVDGMARERQQYSGDCGHQLQAVRFAFGETRNCARYLKTFSQGLTLDGYFLDCWPAFDRLARLMQRQMGTTAWGPLLDHGVGFNFDCWQHYLETGDRASIEEPYPRLLKFAQYLMSIRGDDGLLPAENIGVPAVWIDHNAYKRQRHKQCAFNLYWSAALMHALAPLAEVMGDLHYAEQFRELSKDVLADTVRTFWDEKRRLFVANKPWLDEERNIRLCDRSLATAILYDQCPGNDTSASVKALVECPPEMGFSYPANAGWRLRALGKAGRADVIVKDFRTRWATMPSVRMNGTLQEDWHAEPDTMSQFGHCPVAPIFVLISDIVGLKATAPGFKRFELRPQLADLPDLDITAHSVRGAFRFVSRHMGDHHAVDFASPDGCEGELLLPTGRQPLAGGRVVHFRC
jgi:alpha-L-rhamnosidase